MEFIERNSKLLKSLYKKRSLLVLGPRGSGKSLCLTRLISDISNRMEINLLETDTFKLYLSQPSRLREEVEFNLKTADTLLVFIDEIQKLPQLLDEVHFLIEKYKEKVSFILTGSSARKLKDEKANLLAGRALFVPFVTFRYNEVDFNENLNSILQYGLLPQVFTEKDNNIKSRFLKTYTGTYLKEEIMQEAIVKNIEGFNLFLEVAASVNSAHVNYSKMARQVNISDQSIKGHYQILEDTLWTYRIPAWTFSKKKQLQQSPKYYFFDNGVLNALRGELNIELRESSSRYGDLFENLVIGEIVKTNMIDGHDYQLYNYRSNTGEEIDLIIQRSINAEPIGIEIKSSVNPAIEDLKVLQKFAKDYPKGRAMVLCRTKRPYEKNGVEFYPFIEGIKSIFTKKVRRDF